MMNGGEWYYSQDHVQLCQVMETQALWGETTCQNRTEAKGLSDE